MYATDFYAGIMDVDPVVVEHVSLFKDEHDGKEVSILQAFRRAHRAFRNLRGQTSD